MLFFRRFRRLTRRNSELDEDFAELNKKNYLSKIENFVELGQKPGDLDFLVTKKQVYCMKTVK